MVWKLFNSGHCAECTECDPGHGGNVDPGQGDYVVALAGNPNTGKSTVFNALTGMNQHTGNWPGKTVTRAEGRYTYQDSLYKLIDLPGTYSLLSASTDEEIARDFILFGKPHCTVVVTDATALQRNLNLALQVFEITPRVVVCVNLMDEARRKGLKIDIHRLSEDLGVPVVATAARRKEGLVDLQNAIAEVAQQQRKAKPYTSPAPLAIQKALDELVPMIQSMAPGLPNARWVAYRLLEGDIHVRQAVQSDTLGKQLQYHHVTVNRGGNR